MYFVGNPTGSLVVARWHNMNDVADAVAFRSAIQAAVTATQPAVICADWRAALVVSPDVAEVVSTMLRGANALLQRSAILLTHEHATFNLQTERLVREAGNPNRRTFRDAASLVAWLSEVLSPEENRAAEAFLAEGAAAV
jgi:hypothetical protein